MLVFKTFLALSFLSAAAPESADKLLKSLRDAYAQGGDFQAEFEQKYIDTLRGKERIERGKVWAKADGRVRWSYLDPIPKDFVFDGKVAHFYEPEAAQVIRYDNFQSSPLWAAVQFLWGRGNLESAFEVSLCEDACGEKLLAHERAVALTPKVNIPNVKSAILVFDTQNKRVVRNIQLGHLGDRNEYRFSAFDPKAKPADALFIFPDIPGVEVNIAPSIGAQPK